MNLDTGTPLARSSRRQHGLPVAYPPPAHSHECRDSGTQPLGNTVAGDFGFGFLYAAASRRWTGAGAAAD